MKDFYPIDVSILKNSLKGIDTIDYKKYPELLEILLCIWIAKKENYTRISKEYELGEFELSIRTLAHDFGISKHIANKLIKKFIENEYITVVEKGNSNTKKSIYFNCIFSDSGADSLRPVIQPVKQVNNSSSQEKTDSATDSLQTVNQNSKKDNKKDNKKDIYTASSEALWKLYPHKKNKAKAILKIPKLISEYGYEQIEKCIKRYIAYVESERKNGFSDLKFQGGDRFFGTTYVDYLDENYEETSHDPVEEPKGKVLDFNELAGVKL